MKKIYQTVLAVSMSLVLAACSSSSDKGAAENTQAPQQENLETAAEAEKAAEIGTDDSSETVTSLPKIDMSKWQYNADDDVYWQVGISYCETPADSSYETMGFFIPGAYFEASDNGDGTYTCSVSDSSQAAGYTAKTAPVILPVNTPGYAAMDAPSSYDSNMGYGSISDYTKNGFVLIFAGARGRDAGAPAGVTDFKAAIRYARYNADLIPGNMDLIFSEGMSGGGAQSALIGSTGDSALYTPYLDAIGAVSGVSDAVAGSMCWCPITNLDSADAAYEWNMGTSRSSLSDDEQKISDALTAAFSDYINAAGFSDNGNTLELVSSEDGRYQSGSYYEYIKSEIERSLNNFLSDTEFPYDSDADSSSGGFGGGGGMRGGVPNGNMPGGNADNGNFGGGMPNGAAPNGDFAPDKPDGAPEGGFGGMQGNAAPNGNPPDGNFGDMQGGAPDGNGEAAPNANMPEGNAGNGNEGQAIEEVDQISRMQTSGGISISGTFETAKDYIDALNAEKAWATYDEASNTAKITSIADFAEAVKPASKSLGAFDQLDASQGENTLFGYNDGNGAHFDAALADILSDMGSEYAAGYASDLEKKDSAGNTVDARLMMYTPLYYLMDSYDGKGSSTVARFWRIRTGAWQSDTSITTEINLALALKGFSSVESVDFETVWGQKHTTAERTGESTENFISWVKECAAK